MPFVKGQSGNPAGRPVQPRVNIGAEFLTAIRKVEAKRGIKILEHFVEKALKNDVVLLGLMKKMLPDLKSVDMFMADMNSRLNEDEAMEVRQAMIARMAGAKLDDQDLWGKFEKAAKSDPAAEALATVQPPKPRFRSKGKHKEIPEDECSGEYGRAG